MQDDHSTADWQSKASQAGSGADIPMTPKRLEVYTTLLRAGQALSAY